MIEAQTVSELQDEVSEHDDVVVALQVQEAVQEAISRKLICGEDALTGETLNHVRMMIYEVSKKADPLDVIFQSLMGKTGNPAEAALQFIEKKMRLLQSRKA